MKDLNFCFENVVTCDSLGATYNERKKGKRHALVTAFAAKVVDFSACLENI
jgi:sugar/nucleoside kinase (ribokinase family)